MITNPVASARLFRSLCGSTDPSALRRLQRLVIPILVCVSGITDPDTETRKGSAASTNATENCMLGLRTEGTEGGGAYRSAFMDF